MTPSLPCRRRTRRIAAAVAGLAVVLGTAVTATALANRTPTFITGTIVLADGSAPTRAQVTAYKPARYGYLDGYTYRDSAQVEADGSFSLQLTAGSAPVRLEFSSGRGMIAYYASADPDHLVSTIRLGDDVDISGGGTLDLGTITLPVGGTVKGSIPGRTSGQILDAGSGGPVRGFYARGSSSGPVWSSGKGLLAGTYTLEFGADSAFTPYIHQYLGGVPATKGLGAAQTFGVEDSMETRRDITRLISGGVMSGRLLDSRGRAMAGCTVRAYDPEGVDPTRESTPATRTGAFRIPGLATGRYVVAANGGGTCAGGEAFLGRDGLVRKRSQAITVRIATGGNRSLGVLRMPRR